MIFDNYSTQAAEASLDSLWLKTQVISNNISNANTPGFKQSKVSFEEVYRNQTRSGSSGRNRGNTYKTKVFTEDSRSVREDGNNVQYEAQSIELWKTQAQYSYLMDRVKGHYNTINTVINNMK